MQCCADVLIYPVKLAMDYERDSIVTPDLNSLKTIIAQAHGRNRADAVIKNVTIFNLILGDMQSGDIAVCGDRIVGVGERYDGEYEIDGSGLTAVPGFIDAHVHVESTMVTPFEFERCVMPHGVTAAVCDPHELANTSGTAAIDFFLESARRMCMDLFVQISSCVPATDLETSGASISAEDIKKYIDEPYSLGLAELMNVPGVVGCSDAVLEKIVPFYGRIDGHAPLLSGMELNAYLAAGVRNCHECSCLDEAYEKLSKGMHIFIREGSVARDLDHLMPLINIKNAQFLCFCSDDRNPLDISEAGHLDKMIARAIAGGADPLAVYRIACLSPAVHFGMKGRGLLAPGYKADIVLLSDFNRCEVAKVFKNGREVTAELFNLRSDPPSFAQFTNSMRRVPVTAADFSYRSAGEITPVIGIQEFSLITEHLELALPCVDGMKVACSDMDIAKVAVLERYGKNGNIGRAFVKGFGLKRGAIASSVGHDSHNLCVVGVSDEDMAVAVNALIASGGGLAVACNGGLTDIVPLPVGGIMSDMKFEDLTLALRRIHDSVKLTGCKLESPFLQLAFLPLPVIPFLRITDRGIVDVAEFRIING